MMDCLRTRRPVALDMALAIAALVPASEKPADVLLRFAKHRTTETNARPQAAQTPNAWFWRIGRGIPDNISSGHTNS
jgi:hypothetical protein